MSEKEWRQWIRSKVQGAAPLLWVLNRRLACSSRPLRYHARFGGRLLFFPPEAADALSEWLEAVRQEGIGTITCLATHGELKRYATLTGPDEGLVSFYRHRGFRVHHHPIEDPRHAPREARAGILEQLERLKPVVFDEFQHRSGALLLHCSGGMDRSAPVAAFIAAREETCSGQDDHGS